MKAAIEELGFYGAGHPDECELRMLRFLAMTLCCLMGGAISDWLVRHYGFRTGRCGLSILALCLTAVLVIAGAKAHTAQSASILLASGAGALYLSQSCFWAVTMDIAVSRAGGVSGVMNNGGAGRGRRHCNP